MTRSDSISPTRILMVDDDVLFRTMMGVILADEGYDVTHATDGNNAVELHRQRPFDLVITDLAMDGKDGFRMLMEMRIQNPVRFVATTRLSQPVDDFCRRMAMHLGAHSVLVKPFRPEDLPSAIRNAMARH